MTDLGVGFDKFPAELLEIVELRNLSFCLADRRRNRQRLRVGFGVKENALKSLSRMGMRLAPPTATAYPLFVGRRENWRQCVGGGICGMPEIGPGKGGFNRLQ